MKKNLLLLTMIVPLALDAITVNGKDLKKIIAASQVLSFTPGEGDNIVFAFDGQNLNLGSLTINNHNEIQKGFNFLEQNRDKMSSLTAGAILSVQSGLTSSHEETYLSAREKIILQAGTSMVISNSIMESPRISLIANQLDINCFIKDCKHLQIEPMSEQSPFKVIHFSLSDDSQYPLFAQGIVDLSTGKTDSFTVLGATEVDIVFNKHVFE